MKEFYAALVESSYHVDGDERSRTNPGHGYPAHDVSYTKIVKFDDVEEMKKWVINQKEKTYSREKYQIIKYVELDIELEVKVEVKVK